MTRRRLLLGLLLLAPMLGRKRVLFWTATLLVAGWFLSPSLENQSHDLLVFLAVLTAKSLWGRLLAALLATVRVLRLRDRSTPPSGAPAAAEAD